MKLFKKKKVEEEKKYDDGCLKFGRSCVSSTIHICVNNEWFPLYKIEDDSEDFLFEVYVYDVPISIPNKVSPQVIVQAIYAQMRMICDKWNRKDNNE